jgi:hypothetical protein
VPAQGYRPSLRAVTALPSVLGDLVSRSAHRRPGPYFRARPHGRTLLPVVPRGRVELPPGPPVPTHSSSYWPGDGSCSSGASAGGRAANAAPSEWLSPSVPVSRRANLTARQGGQTPTGLAASDYYHGYWPDARRPGVLTSSRLLRYSYSGEVATGTQVRCAGPIKGEVARVRSSSGRMTYLQ